jgi:hypothetical protein
VLGLARIYNPVFVFSTAAAFAAVPALVILSWVLMRWLLHGIFYEGWALAGTLLLLLASQAFGVGTVALLLKRWEIKVERFARTGREDLGSSKQGVHENPKAQ